MALNSCLYECTAVHSRLDPRPHRFRQRMFWFYLDLAELDELSENSRIFGRNRSRFYNFKDSDHLQGPRTSVRENIDAYVKASGALPPSRWTVLTLVRTAGYVFNPVSFYFGDNGAPCGVVAEVGNTFGEQKPYWISADKFRSGSFRDRQQKMFYISPFMDLDNELDFDLKLPAEDLHLRVDDWCRGKRIFTASVTGNRIPWSERNLLSSALRYPLLPLQVISAIHWQALRLWWKRIPHHRKEDHPELQIGVTRART